MTTDKKPTPTPPAKATSSKSEDLELKPSAEFAAKLDEKPTAPKPAASTDAQAATAAKMAKAAPPKAKLPADFSFDFDPTSMPHLAIVAAVAWDAVKGVGDASFADAAPNFQHILLAHAKSALTTGVLLQGDTNLALFEQEISRLRNAAAK